MRRRCVRVGIVVVLGALVLVGPTASASPAARTRSRTSTVIVFDTRYSAPVSQIFTIHPDGTGRRQLTHATIGAWDPVFSPDGSEIAFVRDGPSGSILALMQADGTDRHRIVGDPGHDDFAPAWTPDGAHILFVRCEEIAGYPCRIAQMDVDGSNRVELTHGTWHDGGGPFGQFFGELSPIVSPGGGHIAFSSDRGGYNTRLFVMESNGDDLHAISQPAIEVGASSWSPDGRWIAGTADPSYGTIYLVHRDGTDLHPIQPGALWPSFSPRGRRLVAVRDTTGSLVTFSIDGGPMTVVPNTDGATFSNWGPAT